MSELTISDLYEMQKKLDERIIREKGLEGVDLLPNTVLALQVEIAELANEWRGFKHWSNDRKPRTEENIIDQTAAGGQIYNIVVGTRNPLLEEYVDCLHFFLSIARQLNLSDDYLYVTDELLEGETTVLFTELLHNVGMINGHLFLNEGVTAEHQIKFWHKTFFRSAYQIFINLGEQRLGFTWYEIAEAYVAKNRINHERQENGY